MKKVWGVESTKPLSQQRAWPRSRENVAHPHDDPYARASIGLGAKSAPPRLSVDQKENRKMKRKVLRHRPDGRVEVSEELMNPEPESSAKLPSPGHPRTFQEDTISEEEFSLEDYDDEWQPEERPCYIFGELRSTRPSHYSALTGLPTSYIVQSITRQNRTDPVATLNRYKQDWERYTIPGEDSHQDVRWAVRRQMSQSEQPRQARRSIVPNTHKVPTAKRDLTSRRNTS